MHRKLILDQLDSYKRKRPEETDLANRFVEFIEENPNCFDRSLLKGHLTGSCWLWNASQTACLFTLHKKLGMWLQLGGHADGDSNLLNVALKEAQEESGILEIEALSNEIFDLSIHEIPSYKEVPTHLHYDVRFILRVKEDIPFKISSESEDLRWISLEDFKNYDFDPSILKMRDKVNYLLSS